jgi:hypothetical protein
MRVLNPHFQQYLLFSFNAHIISRRLQNETNARFAALRKPPFAGRLILLSSSAAAMFLPLATRNR